MGPFINFVLAALLGIVFVATGGRTALHEVYLLTQLSLLDQILLIGGFANIMLGVFNLIPVSYTHLDVYKRQPSRLHPDR